jgi:hypothetical protein
MHPFSDLTLKAHRPDQEETGRAHESIIAVAARLWPATFQIYFVEQLAYPTVSDSPSTEIIGSSPDLCRR